MYTAGVPSGLRKGCPEKEKAERDECARRCGKLVRGRRVPVRGFTNMLPGGISVSAM